MAIELSKKQENHIKKWLDKKTVYQIASECSLSVYMVRKKVKEYRAEAARLEAEKAKTAEAANQPRPLGGLAVAKGTVSMTESGSLRGDESAGHSPFSSDSQPAPKENAEFFAKHKNAIHRIR